MNFALRNQRIARKSSLLDNRFNQWFPRAEQEAILSAIEGRTADLDRTVERLHQEIELLREYRTRFVADVVTGQLDVRGAALHLPSTVPLDLETEPGDEADEGELIDEEAAEA